MGYDADLMRDIALELETLQRSPPEPILLELLDIAERNSRSCYDVVAALDALRRLDLIEGPGAFSDSWLFRRITARGQVFVNEIRDPLHWRKIKQSYRAGQIS